MHGHTRYPLRRGLLGNLLLLTFFFATRSRCYVELGPDRLDLRIGWARVRIELSKIERAELKPTGLRYQLGRTWKMEAARELMFAYGSGDHVLLT